MSDFLLNVSVDAIVRLLACASTEQTRYYLNGVHVRKRRGTPGLILEATNGHCLAMENDEAGEIPGCAEFVVGGPSYIVARWTIAAIEKAAKAQAKIWKIKRDKMRVLIGDKGFALAPIGKDGQSAVYSVAPQTSCFIEGTFPDCERVMPQVDASNLGTKDAYSAEQIACLSMSAPDTDGPRAYVLYSAGIGNPALVRFTGALNWLGVVMPCRIDAASTCHNPAWFGRPTPATAKAA